jgi:HEPN domain-containing protein
MSLISYATLPVVAIAAGVAAIAAAPIAFPVVALLAAAAVGVRELVARRERKEIDNRLKDLQSRHAVTSGEAEKIVFTANTIITAGSSTYDFSNRTGFEDAGLQEQRMSDLTDHIFISAAMHYYVTGRYAVFAGLNPTAANLLHHAVEMALKGALAKKGRDLKALKALGHDLPEIWREFTAQYGIDGRTFDGVIAELQKFETIRYPDEIVKQGLTSLISRGKPTPPSGHTTHALWLGEIDELMDKVFTVGSISHNAYVSGLHMSDATEYLIKENEVATWKQAPSLVGA